MATTDRPEIKPLTKSVTEILADFLGYMSQCAKDYIRETDPVGKSLLDSNADIAYVLTHPNDWEGDQRSIMLRAAVLAKLVPDNGAGHSRIRFISEGEANFHFCAQAGRAETAIGVRGLIYRADECS